MDEIKWIVESLRAGSVLAERSRPELDGKVDLQIYREQFLPWLFAFGNQREDGGLSCPDGYEASDLGKELAALATRLRKELEEFPETRSPQVPEILDRIERSWHYMAIALDYRGDRCGARIAREAEARHAANASLARQIWERFSSFPVKPTLPQAAPVVAEI